MATTPRFFAGICAPVLTPWLAGCDTAPQPRDGVAMPVPPGMARLYFYRGAVYDPLVPTAVWLSGGMIGRFELAGECRG